MSNDKLAATFYGANQPTLERVEAYERALGCSRDVEPDFCRRHGRLVLLADGVNYRCPSAVDAAGVEAVRVTALRLERDALQDALNRVLDALPACFLCGEPFRARACGPKHAVIAEDPASHRIFGEAR